MLLTSGTFTTQGAYSTDIFKPTGRVSIWRGTGTGTVGMEKREGAGGTWRDTGDAMTDSGSYTFSAGNLGQTEYRLKCSSLQGGQTIDYEVSV